MNDSLNNISLLNKNRIEAILFVSNKPVSLNKIVRVLNIPPDTIYEFINELNNNYKKTNASFFIEELANGFIFASKPELDDVIRVFYNLEEKLSLTDLNLEILAIIAYNQPLTRSEIDAVRGNIDSTFHIKTLLEKGFIKIAGRKKVPGSPFLYGTTKQFLIYFGLKNLSDLPRLEEIKDEFLIRGDDSETDTLPGFE
ncbi:SMC-Scp complex subunit ScpB [bacterium]|nr:SMC-Scp complex subunit ScpB [bacterium]